MTPFYHAIQLPLFVTSKVCPDCGEEKPLEAFHKHRSKPDGHAVYCKACKKKQDALYSSTHTEQKKALNAAYKAKNSEQISVLGQVRYLKNREQKIAYEQKRYLANREQKIAYEREWRQSNPLKQREFKKRRRARKKGVTATRVSYKRILERDGYWCYICEQDILPHHKIHFDHVVPLVRGGAHADFNIKPTHDVCNMRKHVKLIEELTPYERRGVS